jgi:hypothetical protein
MAWNWKDDEAFGELMEEYPRIEPAIERIVLQDAEVEQMSKELDALKHRVFELESRPQPLAKYGLGPGNPLLQAAKEKARQS